MANSQTHEDDGPRRRPAARSLLLCVFVLVLATTACGGGGGSPSPSTGTIGHAYALSTAVISSRSTQDIRVWAPTDEGHWPVVYALPGISGNKSDFDQLGPALARRGVVVFATDYRPNGTAGQVVRDVICGYRYVRSVAHEYGGDLSQPVTGVGYSAGARFISIVRAPQFGPGGSYRGCPTATSPADVLVGINGCYYAHQGLTFTFSTAPLGSTDVTLLLVTGQADDECASWQSEKAARALGAAGFDATLVPIRSANHYTPIFHDLVHGRWTTVPHDAAGEQTTWAIIDAIHFAG